VPLPSCPPRRGMPTWGLLSPFKLPWRTSLTWPSRPWCSTTRGRSSRHSPSVSLAPALLDVISTGRAASERTLDPMDWWHCTIMMLSLPSSSNIFGPYPMCRWTLIYQSRIPSFKEGEAEPGPLGGDLHRWCGKIHEICRPYLDGQTQS